MITVDNKRNAFYNLLKDGLIVAGGFTNIVTTLDSNVAKSPEIFISIEDDNLLIKTGNESYGTALEERSCNFAIIIRNKQKKTSDVMETARNQMNVILDKAERLIRDIEFKNYQIVVSSTIRYYVNVNDIQIKTSAYILDELSEAIIDGSIIYEFSK